MTRYEKPKNPITTAFTLIELLVVIAIIALLVSLLMPSLRQAKELSRTAVCQAHIRSVGVATPQYMGDHDDYLPAYGVAVDPSEYDLSECDESIDGPAGGVGRFMLITKWGTNYMDPVRGGDGIYAPYLNNSDKRKTNLLGCPSVPDRIEYKEYVHWGVPHIYAIERGKSYCHNFNETTRMEGQESHPLLSSKISFPSELVHMADGPGRAVHFHLISESGWPSWTADIPTARHFDEFTMVFCDGHVEIRPMVGTFPDPYFRREE